MVVRGVKQVIVKDAGQKRRDFFRFEEEEEGNRR